ncbi:MAG TPA: haloalkane dehalogenase, partial [Elusimicrobiota bacterium]|nr:haloalkane dehalogenase [Elusimicrobiota bacterium]
GGRDPIFNARILAEWERRFPNAVVDRFPGAGHYVLEDAHEFILPRLREFLAAPAP